METLHVFGRYENLVGWFHAPTSQPSRSTAVVMLTAGMLHHVGPMRLHVQLARRLGAAGIPSFRYDLSGIGESLAVAAGGPSLDRARNELGAALDLLEAEYGLRKFVLFGLCSGADDAFTAAVDEPRVVGLSLLDGCGFRTTAFQRHRFWLKYWPKIWSARKWSSLARSLVRRINRRGVASVGASTMPMGDDIREFGEQADCERRVQQLLERRVAQQWIYTGGAVDYYSYANQFHDMFPEVAPSSLLSIEHLPRLDHLACLREDRETLLRRITQWCDDLTREPRTTTPTVRLPEPVCVPC
ncbi:MAG: alpha/beta hydrolase [Planctomycetales bacterium]|nr:alpha/beta hydrolase [Planctomycetales bacterium]